MACLTSSLMRRWSRSRRSRFAQQPPLPPLPQPRPIFISGGLDENGRPHNNPTTTPTTTRTTTTTPQQPQQQPHNNPRTTKNPQQTSCVIPCNAHHHHMLKSHPAKRGRRRVAGGPVVCPLPAPTLLLRPTHTFFHPFSHPS